MTFLFINLGDVNLDVLIATPLLSISFASATLGICYSVIIAVLLFIGRGKGRDRSVFRGRNVL